MKIEILNWNFLKIRIPLDGITADTIALLKTDDRTATAKRIAPELYRFIILDYKHMLEK